MPDILFYTVCMMQLKSYKAYLVPYVQLVRICSLAVLAFTIVRGLRPEIFQALEFKMMPLWKIFPPLSFQKCSALHVNQ